MSSHLGTGLHFGTCSNQTANSREVNFHHRTKENTAIQCQIYMGFVFAGFIPRHIEHLKMILFSLVCPTHFASVRTLNAHVQIHLCCHIGKSTNCCFQIQQSPDSPYFSLGVKLIDMTSRIFFCLKT